MQTPPYIAYFSMEIGLAAQIPSYSGGLGILAGDTIRSAADLGLPMVAVSLVHRKGYFHQSIDQSGWQIDEPEDWSIQEVLTEIPQRIKVEIESRKVTIRAWRYDIKGIKGHIVPVYLLDTDLEENGQFDRTLTHYLYGGDDYYRLCQEVVLGMGGVRILRALGLNEIHRYHMNEGHASLLVIELLSEYANQHGLNASTKQGLEEIRQLCVFTTHTPVAAGHDKFPSELAQRVLGEHPVYRKAQPQLCCEDVLNMTYLALDNSHYVNGVTKTHRTTSSLLFANHQIDSITNGVHAATWAAEDFARLYDKLIPSWREDNASLRYAINIPKQEIWAAHQHAKQRLLDYVKNTTEIELNPDLFTIGFARRFTEYKRPDLLFFDIDQLLTIYDQVGRFQILYSGKAHPHDTEGKRLIQQIWRIKATLKGRINIVFLNNYNMNIAQLMVAGCDLWLNTPQPPLEASGTSGMKAALNGVPSLSVMDGWWIEGCIEGITGWSITNHRPSSHSHEDTLKEAKSLYDKLGLIILPMYYHETDRYIEVMRHAIAINGSFFNTERMLNQYVAKAYFK